MRNLTLAASIILLSAPLMAEEEASAPESPWSGSAELGYIKTSGNTETSSTNAALKVKHKGENWDKQVKLSALTSKDRKTTTKEKYDSEFKADRNFGEHSYMTGVATYGKDRFSGFDYQSTASIGYGYRAIAEKDMELNFEFGPGHRRDKVKGSEEADSETIGRFALSFDWQIQQGVDFSEDFVALKGKKKGTYKSETSLKSQLMSSLASKITYKIKHETEVPEGARKTDRELGITLVYSF